MNILAQSIPDDERIVTIEDTAELRIEKPNICPSNARPIRQRATFVRRTAARAALAAGPHHPRRSPRYRGANATRFLQYRALRVARHHPCQLCRKGLRRFANLVLRSHSQATFADIEAEIGEAVDFVVHIEREPGRRIVREVLRDRYDRRSQQFETEYAFPTETQPIVEAMSMLKNTRKSEVRGPQSLRATTFRANGWLTSFAAHHRSLRPVEDIRSVQLWLADGIPIGDVLTTLETEHRFEFSRPIAGPLPSRFSGPPRLLPCPKWTAFPTPRSPVMPLLEIAQTRHYVSAMIRIEDTTAQRIDQYAAFFEDDC